MYFLHTAFAASVKRYLLNTHYPIIAQVSGKLQYFKSTDSCKTFDRQLLYIRLTVVSQMFYSCRSKSSCDVSGQNVYANVNTPSLGTIDDSPYSIVYKEFTNGKSCFKLREQAPCNNCIYQWLCPTPSNYETVLELPNLCHVKNKNM